MIYNRNGGIGIYIAVCDDNASELETLTSLLDQWRRACGVSVRYKTFQTTAGLLDMARRESFTLYLLDVMMPGLNGMDTARELRCFDATAEIVFLTVSPEFAYQSYGVKALDYLLKPVHPELLFPILDRLALEEQRPQEGLVVKCGSTLVRILFSQLAYVEVNRKHLYFNLTNGQVREVFGTLNDYEPLLLSQPEFRRVHRSYIVNLHQVKELSPAGIHTFSGNTLPISRLLFSQIQTDYLNLLFEEKTTS